MITIYGGKLGAGKTLSCTMRVYELLCQGRVVVSNIEFYFDEFYKLAARQKGILLDRSQLRYVDPETDRNWQDVIPFGTPGNPVEVFFDEIHLFFNSRDWAQTQKNSPGLISFLSQSRKAFVNVTFIVQDSETLDKQFRAQAEWEFFVMSSDHIPLGPLGKFPIKFMIVRKMSAKKGTFISREFRGYDKRFFKLYNSFSFLDEQMKGLGAKAERCEKIKLRRLAFWKRPFARIFPGLIPPPLETLPSPLPECAS